MNGGLHHDIDQLGAEYEALIQFLYLAPVGLVQADLRGEIALMNPVAAQLLMPHSRDGGLDNLFTAIGGALVTGLAVAAAEQLIGPGYELVTLFVVLSVVLLLRPHGLFAFRGSAERV